MPSSNSKFEEQEGRRWCLAVVSCSGGGAGGAGGNCGGYCCYCWVGNWLVMEGVAEGLVRWTWELLLIFLFVVDYGGSGR